MSTGENAGRGMRKGRRERGKNDFGSKEILLLLPAMTKLRDREHLRFSRPIFKKENK